MRDFLIYGGAKFICPVCGAISLMPGTSSDPAFRKVDVDTKTTKSPACSKLDHFPQGAPGHPA